MPFSKERWRWLLYLIAAVSILYLLLLLTNVYQSQGQLRAAANARLLAESRQTAALMDDFLAGQERFVVDLAELHEIGTYLVNRSLGMSMRYGLNANLAAIDNAFRRKIAQQRLFGAPLYERFLYLDEQGALLVDTAPRSPRDPHIQGHGQTSGLIIDPEHDVILAFARVGYRDTPGGVVITVARLDLLSHYLTSTPADLGFGQFLIDGEGRAVAGLGRGLPNRDTARLLAGLPPGTLTPIDELTGLDATRLGAAGCDLVLRTPVAHGELSIVTVLPVSLLYGHITSRGFLYFASGVPPVLLFAALWIGRMRQRNQRLEADVIASNRDRAELRHRNDALTVEIARRKALEIQLRESEERYRTYIEHAPEGIVVCDRLGRIVDTNPSACAMLGYTRPELLRLRTADLVPPAASGDQASALELIQAQCGHELEIGLTRKDGTRILASLRSIALPDDLVMSFCVDITDRKLAEEQIHNLAYYDPLTGLPNRRLFHDRLRQLMASSHRSREYGVLLMLDLDHFKDLNDTQGHDIGDRLLSEVARRLSAKVRREDTVARLGGDEYVIIAGELGTDETLAAAQAEQIAEQIHHALDAPYHLDPGRPPHRGPASIGVTLFRGRDTDAELLLKQADVALYQAKSAGRNTIRFFNPEMQATLEARAALETTLRKALTKKELCLHYQPQVDRNGCLVGAEALLRWLPADGEPIPPAHFITLAEETGIIIPIGIWVLGQACAQLKIWQADPRTRRLVLSINVSARQFLQPDFVDQVRDHIRALGIDARGLNLELTEGIVLDHVDQVMTRMTSLGALGVGFSLDDFGTGYSSLSYLERLPLDQVKIDRSCVHDLVHDQKDAAIVRAVLAMTRSLGLTAVAEGVETREQRAFLLDHGCERFQGYLFGRPVPVEEFHRRLDRYQRPVSA